jgi:hypothetical protein
VRGQIGKEYWIEYKYVYPSTDKYRMNIGMGGTILLEVEEIDWEGRG